MSDSLTLFSPSIFSVQYEPNTCMCIWCSLLLSGLLAGQVSNLYRCWSCEWKCSLHWMGLTVLIFYTSRVERDSRMQGCHLGAGDRAFPQLLWSWPLHTFIGIKRKTEPKTFLDVQLLALHNYICYRSKFKIKFRLKYFNLGLFSIFSLLFPVPNYSWIGAKRQKKLRINLG